MTQSKTYVEQLPGKTHRRIFSNSIVFSFGGISEPPNDLNEYLSTRQNSTITQSDINPVSLSTPALEESDQGGSSMITT